MEPWTLIVCVLIISVTFLVSNRTSKQIKEPVLDYPTAMAILQETIKDTIATRNMEYKIAERVLIDDYQEELTYLTREVMSSISLDLLDNLTFYHSERYIISYVKRRAEEYLINFIKYKSPNFG